MRGKSTYVSEMIWKEEARYINRSAAEQRVRVDSFEVVNARICTAAEDRHIDVVELCCIAEPETVLARDRLLFLRCLYCYFPCLQPNQLVAIMFTGSVHV